LEELLLILEQIIKETGGIQGTLNPEGLEMALKLLFTSFSGE